MRGLCREQLPRHWLRAVIQFLCFGNSSGNNQIRCTVLQNWQTTSCLLKKSNDVKIQIDTANHWYIPISLCHQLNWSQKWFELERLPTSYPIPQNMYLTRYNSYHGYAGYAVVLLNFALLALSMYIILDADFGYGESLLSISPFFRRIL